MKKIAIVIGGSGYIGGFLIRELIRRGRFEQIVNIDLNEASFPGGSVLFIKADIRKPIEPDIAPFNPEESWIFHLAALCREPGSEPREYFDTNVGGTANVLAFSERTGCRNIFFTSTMSTYGRAQEPTPEDTPQYAETPYGISKLVAEKMHLAWLAKDARRRLIICRPSVIFGPGDVGNILRMIKAVRKGYFFFPGDPGITKAYGYIHGLIDSIFFVMEKGTQNPVVYNYAEQPLRTLAGMVETIKARSNRKVFTLRIPFPILYGVAALFQVFAKMVGINSPIHPVRVKKVASLTNIQPKYLMDHGFPFKYPLEAALDHWKKESPGDF